MLAPESRPPALMRIDAMPAPQRAQLALGIQPQPDDTTCGPTCLHAVYQFWGEDISLRQVINETQVLPGGGTLAVHLACHALERGFDATIWTYNLKVFDPTWFTPPGMDLRDRLERQLAFKGGERLESITRGYLRFLELGGTLKFQELRTRLIRRPLTHGIPVITGLSATYLYGSAREWGPNDDYDDIRGEPSGHFVVLSGYDRKGRLVDVSDPLLRNPMAEGHHYLVGIERVIGAIMLGVLTHDANLLTLTPVDHPSRTPPT